MFGRNLGNLLLKVTLKNPTLVSLITTYGLDPLTKSESAMQKNCSKNKWHKCLKEKDTFWTTTNDKRCFSIFTYNIFYSIRILKPGIVE